MPFPCRLAPLSLGLCALLSSSLACAASTTLPELSVTADRDRDDPRVEEVTTATRTSTPVRYVPQAIDSIKTSNL
ncbi:TonB-dependent siderophore receptor, partial [Pseudomonas sp. MAFF212428]|nr:TonB-dependent siderophore receptor [Pseudomonas brassicae]